MARDMLGIFWPDRSSRTVRQAGRRQESGNAWSNCLCASQQSSLEILHPAGLDPAAIGWQLGDTDRKRANGDSPPYRGTQPGAGVALRWAPVTTVAPMRGAILRIAHEATLFARNRPVTFYRYRQE